LALAEVLYHVIVFAQGPVFVASWKAQVHFPFGIEYLEILTGFALQVYYFIRAYQLYRGYRSWVPSQFSDTEAVDFRWFRNFLWAFLATTVISWVVNLLDIWFNLDFWHDWWDELFTAGIIYYLCVSGYAQWQPRKMHFEAASNAIEAASKIEKVSEAEMERWYQKTEKLMTQDKLYLEPEPSLSDLAQRLNTNVSILSAVVNGTAGKNFNDFVNEHRKEAVKKLLNHPSVKHLSLLAIPMDSGFNSKSTFSRAFKKATSKSPRELRDTG